MNGTASLDAAFHPGSVAIAGVGIETAGRCYLESFVSAGFKGSIYPLNPKGGEISGFRVYPNVMDTPGPIDYLVSCLPARLVPGLIGDSSRKGVKVVSLFTAGFSEVGSDAGRRLEAEVVSLARAGGVRLIGPNCMGVYCPKGGVSFVSDFPREGGSVAFICQSGGNTMHVVRSAAQRGVRFSKVVSYGNACDVNESDLFEYFVNDAETTLIAAYVEGTKDGSRFYRVLSELAAGKPVVLLKGGLTEAGSRTAASHTGSLAGSARVWTALLQQAGVIQVGSLQELVDMMVTFLFMPVPKGRRVGIAGGGGGASVLSTDDCARSGFIMPATPAAAERDIRGFLASDAGTIVSNPIEISMFPEASHKMARRLIGLECVDLLLADCVFGQHPWPMFDSWYDIFCDVIIGTHAESPKPIGVVMHSDVPADKERYLALERRYYEAGLPVYRSVSGACRAVDRFMRYHERKSGASGPKSPRRNPPLLRVT
ncbi:MAG: CoA-binding protein [Chloroflexi bacterium]|nr:CoA-binding protein [Chloroflexota bacterium]